MRQSMNTDFYFSSSQIIEPPTMESWVSRMVPELLKTVLRNSSAEDPRDAKDTLRSVNLPDGESSTDGLKDCAGLLLLP